MKLWLNALILTIGWQGDFDFINVSEGCGDDSNYRFTVLLFMSILLHEIVWPSAQRCPP